MSSFSDPYSGFAAYGFVICLASMFIRVGAANIRLPVLCTIPTSLLALSSCLGPAAQYNASAGLGVLAGSNVMLLCFSWFLCVLSGRSTGVELSDEVKETAYHVLGTSVTYIVIEVVSLFVDHQSGVPVSDEVTMRDGRSESTCIVASVCMCFFLLVVHFVVRHVQAKARAARLLDANAARLLDEVHRGEHAPGDEGDGIDEGDGMNEEIIEDLAISGATLMKSFCMIGISTFVVLVFADYAIVALVAMSADLDVNPFYVSFVLAPLATNGSELFASCWYGRKKTRRSVRTCLTHLEGAAVGNNTIGLGIFLCVFYSHGLAWQFTAETLSILMVQALWFIYVMVKKVQTVIGACCVLCLYPLSLMFVWYLQYILKFD